MTSYLVLGTQRSGSTLLVESLASTGIAGQPREWFQYDPATSLSPEPRMWFDGVDDPSITDLLDSSRDGMRDHRTRKRWLADVVAAGTSENGMWGGKLMWNQTPLLRSRIGIDDLATAMHAINDEPPVLIYVHRPDVVAAAVSFWRALQTRIWRGRDTHAAARAVYHHDAIAHLAGKLERDHAEWLRWFRENGTRPDVTVSYDELDANYTATIRRVLRALQLDPDAAPLEPVLDKQRDERSAQWAAWFRSESNTEVWAT